MSGITDNSHKVTVTSKPLTTREASFLREAQILQR